MAWLENILNQNKMTYRPDNKDWMEGAEWMKKAKDEHNEYASKQTKVWQKNNKIFQKKMVEEITNIKIDMAEQKSDIKYIRKSLDDHIRQQDIQMKDFTETINNWIDGSSDKFASKLTERIVYSLVSLILIGVVGIWINAVIKHPGDNNLENRLSNLEKLLNKAEIRYEEVNNN